MANMSKTKCPMPSQDPLVRAGNFQEVALGYTEEMAVEEAQRCLNCKNKPCHEGCPVGIDIPGFISKVAERDFAGAYDVLSLSTTLAAVCGRVCPQENQCEGKCVRGQGRKRGHRPSGAFRSRLAPGKCDRYARKGRVQRPQGGGGRLRPQRPDLRR